MVFIVIENWENLSSPQIVMNEDGETKVFDKLKDAVDEAYGCQDGIVVPLSNDIVSAITDAVGFVDVAKYELHDETDDDNLERRLNDLITDEPKF